MSDAALDAVPAGVLSLADDLTITAANQGLGAIVGRDAATYIGEPFDALLSVPARILFQTHVYPALKADGRVDEVFLTLTDGTQEPPTPVLLNAVRQDGPDGTAYSVVVVRIQTRARWETELLDATRAIERERIASEQLAARLAATAEDLAARHAESARDQAFRDAFIGVVSHELRTPITTIFGMSQLLSRRLSTMDPELVAQHLDDIADESDRLRRLTEDLLVLSRAEGRKLTVSDDPILIAHVVRDAVEEEATRAPDHAFTTDIVGSLPIVVGEATYVEQVLRNLLSNAAKYSPAGSPIRVQVTAEDGGVAVRVIDAGPGVPDAAVDHLFEAFYRAPDAVRAAAGAGIGLFVSRELVEVMGGRIWVRAAPAPAVSGSEFGFWLPATFEVDEP
ncbi:MAG: ATP-binding protein [Candidatus Limnocylindrales bacterium]